MKTINILCHTIVPSLIKDAKIAIDCGSNKGEFANWISENSSAKVYAFEPDPRLFASLPALPRVFYFPIAVDGKTGEFDLALGEANCSSAIYRENAAQKTVRVKKTTLDEFCQGNGLHQIDFVKIDIEGAELSLLENISETLLRNTTQITVEFHDFLRKQDRPRIRQIFRRMKRLGFYCVCFSFFTWGDCLFINKTRVRITLLDRVRMQLLGKYATGIKRFLERKL